MVAITVVLAAVIGGFVMNMGDSLSDPAPSTQIDFDYDSGSDTLTVTHDGGEVITGDNTGNLIVEGNEATDFPYSAGDEIATVSSASSNSPVDVVWESPEGESSRILDSWEE